MAAGVASALGARGIVFSVQVFLIRNSIHRVVASAVRQGYLPVDLAQLTQLFPVNFQYRNVATVDAFANKAVGMALLSAASPSQDVVSDAVTLAAVGETVIAAVVSARVR